MGDSLGRAGVDTCDASSNQAENKNCLVSSQEAESEKVRTWGVSRFWSCEI